MIGMANANHHMGLRRNVRGWAWMQATFVLQVRFVGVLELNICLILSASHAGPW